MASLNEALQIIRRHQANPPVQTVSIAKELGIAVYRVPGWSGDLSGMIKKNPGAPGGYDIYVNGDHPLNRRRFTIAHEIAHAVLHPQLIGDGITDDALLRSGLSNSVEAQANKMAADILMPWHLLSPLIKKGKTSVTELAQTFQVSEQAMSIRLGVPQ